MRPLDQTNPFHAGERAAQVRAGVGDVAKWAGSFIRDYLPEQHRAFHTSQPFLVVSGADMVGLTWVTIVEGEDGFATSPDPRRIELDTLVDDTDPLAAAFREGTEIGVLGIELATRRRNRFSGVIRHLDEDHGVGARYSIDVRQSFGNCPQYIHERAWSRVPRKASPGAQKSVELSAAQIAMIEAADTMFIGSGHQGEAGAASNGYDASHRGGLTGFVKVASSKRLLIPDFAGNNFFNTIGNLLTNPRVGVLFVDFETGGLLHVTGRATIDWNPANSPISEVRRVIEVEIDAVVHRPAALSLRWARQGHLSRRLRLARRVKESASITSFYLEPIDGQPLDLFEAGQHLPIEVQIPGQVGISKRSYSLSGNPADRGQYRLSIKREDKGLVSRYLHDSLREGQHIDARAPSGEFVIPCSNCPLVLVSAGVGLTPMLAMLHAAAGQNRQVWFVHGTRNAADHALGGEVAAVANKGSIETRTFYSRPASDDTGYDRQGRITAHSLIELGAGPNARYMLCGPAAFLADIRTGLEAAGVPTDNILFETFGPTG